MINEYSQLNVMYKLEKLLDEYRNSAKLSHTLGVSRTSLVRWMEKPQSIKEMHLLDINVLYCDTFVTPALAKVPLPDAVLLPDDYQPELTNSHFRSMTFGTYEIEHMNADSRIFEKIISEESLPRGIDKTTFMAMYNTWISMTQLIASIKAGEAVDISDAFVRDLHSQFMRGVRTDAGQSPSESSAPCSCPVPIGSVLCVGHCARRLPARRNTAARSRRTLRASRGRAA